MYKKMRQTVPQGWGEHSNVGKPIPGTRFIAFKVPLKEEICRKSVGQDQWFTPSMLLSEVPKLKLVINLTNTVDGRYYNEIDITKNGIRLERFQCEGQGKLPAKHIMNKFFDTVDNFIATEDSADSLIGVHCTHGLNRTGYFVCKYMIDRMNMPAVTAIELFEQARGHAIERFQYIDALKQNPGGNQHQNESSALSWRSEQRQTRGNSYSAQRPSRHHPQSSQNSGYNRSNTAVRENESNTVRNNDYRSPLEDAYDDYTPSSSRYNR